MLPGMELQARISALRHAFRIQITYHCLPLCACPPALYHQELRKTLLTSRSHSSLSTLSTSIPYDRYFQHCAHITVLRIHNGCRCEELWPSPSSFAVDPSGRDPTHQLTLRWHYRRPTLRPHIRRQWLRKWQPLPDPISKSRSHQSSINQNKPH